MSATQSILEQVIEELARACAIPAAAIEPNATLVEHGLDSARAMKLMLALEERFDIQIPDEAVPRLRTVRDVAEFVERFPRRSSE
jgi:acyl carrier protein